MAQTISHAPRNGTRLVRLLNDLSLTGVATPGAPLTERLAMLIDLPDSIRISDSHGRQSNALLDSPAVDFEAIRKQFLEAQAAIVEYIVGSFTTGRGARVELPPAPDMAPTVALTACEPYLEFYIALQRQIELKVLSLHGKMRNSVSGSSPRLSQLCELDAVLGSTLSGYSRKAFNEVPALLAQRFDQLLSEYQLGLIKLAGQQATWAQVVDGYLDEMRATLLAETEARLLPTLGLVETINEDTDNIAYE